MKILYLTAGAANMYCGSCLRDNALASELIREGHDVMLLPVYTPTLTDERNVSRPDKGPFGGISAYLQTHASLSRRTPSTRRRCPTSETSADRTMFSSAASASISSNTPPSSAARPGSSINYGTR